MQSTKLIVLAANLNAALETLLDERDAAFVQGEMTKVGAAEQEAEELGILVANVQFAINRDLALNLEAVASRIEESIVTQLAAGLSSAADVLVAALGRLRGTSADGSGDDDPADSDSDGDSNTDPVPDDDGDPDSDTDTDDNTDPGTEPDPGNEPDPGTEPDPGADDSDNQPGGDGDSQSDPVDGNLGSRRLRAKPGPHQAVVNALIAGAEAEALDPLSVLTIVAIESDFRVNAQNPHSSAGGLFQFIDSTWLASGGRQFPGRGGKGNGHAAAASLDVQIDIGCRFIRSNFRSLAGTLGRDPTTTMLYMAHQQGLGGARKILTANRSARIEDIVGVQQARLNGFGGKTVAQTIEKFRTMVRSNADDARALVVEVASDVVQDDPGQAADLERAVAPKAASLALSEMEMFGRRNNGAVIKETSNPLHDRVLEYFAFVNRGDITNAAAEPWSAAFISFVVRRAGAEASQFPKSANHAKYILKGLSNRIANDEGASIVYYDLDEFAPRVGDLIGFSRTSSVRNRADVERFLPNKFFKSHTDLVIDVSPTHLTVIGGNVSNTIKTTKVAIDADGHVKPGQKYFLCLALNI